MQSLYILVHSAFDSFFNSVTASNETLVSGYYEHIANNLPISWSILNLCMIPSLMSAVKNMSEEEGVQQGVVYSL